MRKGGTLRLLVFGSWSVPSKSLHADKADRFIVPLTVLFAPAGLLKTQMSRQHWCSNLLGLLQKQKATGTLPVCTLPQSFGSLPGLHRVTDLNNQLKSISIIYICPLLKALLETILTLSAFHFLIYFPGLQNSCQAHAQCSFIRPTVGQITLQFLYFPPLTEEHGCQWGSREPERVGLPVPARRKVRCRASSNK